MSAGMWRTLRTRWLPLAPCVALAGASTMLLLGVALAWQSHEPARTTETAAPARDPAAWGDDHVGRPVPAFMESGECLFCHRNEVGGSWQTNKHNRTIRDALASEPAMRALLGNPATKDVAGEVSLILGDTRAQRFLKRSAAYGKVDLLNTRATFGRGARARLEDAQSPRWDPDHFARRCAGCHATAVDPRTQAFATVSLECYTCHGVAPEEHTEDASQILLAKERRDPPEVVISICGSCHLRNGVSRSSGLPYPNNFVPGDNLFKDYQVDFDQADDENLNPADRHVLRNTRDVALAGSETTCLTCHDVHVNSSAKHRELPAQAICFDCHQRAEPIKGHTPYEVHSERCEY